jgi:hypothetical protein
MFLLSDCILSGVISFASRNFMMSSRCTESHTLTAAKKPSGVCFLTSCSTCRRRHPFSEMLWRLFSLRRRKMSKLPSTSITGHQRHNPADLKNNLVLWRRTVPYLRNMGFHKTKLKYTLRVPLTIQADSISVDSDISINPDILIACSYGVKTHYFVTTLTKIR